MAVETLSAEPVLDYDGALARFGGDKQLFIEMAGILLEDTPQLHAELATAAAEKNASSIRSRAHALKGLVASCGGVRAAKVCQSLEDAGQSGELSQVDSLMETLDSEIEQLTAA